VEGDDERRMAEVFSQVGIVVILIKSYEKYTASRDGGSQRSLRMTNRDSSSDGEVVMT